MSPCEQEALELSAAVRGWTVAWAPTGEDASAAAATTATHASSRRAMAPGVVGLRSRIAVAPLGPQAPSLDADVVGDRVAEGLDLDRAADVGPVGLGRTGEHLPRPE